MVYAKWYLFVLSLKRWHRYAITALLLIVLLLVWLLALYLPLHKQTIAIQVQLNQFKQDLQTNVSERESCKGLLQEIEELEHATNVVAASSLKKAEENIGLIVNQMESLAITLLSIKKSGSISKGLYRTTLVSVQAEGQLASIIQFFNVLKNNQCLVQSSHFILQHEKDDLYTLYAELKFFSMAKELKNESPSTLEKS